MPTSNFDTDLLFGTNDQRNPSAWTDGSRNYLSDVRCGVEPEHPKLRLVSMRQSWRQKIGLPVLHD